ncbi:alpha/beta hydrolase [Lysobacter sp. S4-A87]|uniref:alpha/beta fold hydrolase n=1 Tax=Lysobacter sp. S4-A87 TaxID=2925843 RepID=UPI001F52E56F|nr:alpha/beta hydrolase [Lysobacter sp. S4-A87]UNK49836.1 alpha/beta hydrolase [Lysobacter sp. S4-A87]
MSAHFPVHHRTVRADGVEFFYRESGDSASPTLLLIHGFPTSSHMYRRLLTELADEFHVIAPDLPGFGFTQIPDERAYVYTFDALGNSLQALVEALDMDRYILYVFDYGAPAGLRLALQLPERVAGIISQNGNAYLEGLGDAFGPTRQYWEHPTPENRNALRGILTLEGTRWQYEHGVADPTLLAPETWQLDHMLLQRPGNDEIQLDLFYDYRTNLTLYPRFQAFFREHRVPTLVIWGEHDPFFRPPGADAFLRDNPDARVELLDTGHFALETHAPHIMERIRETFGTRSRG